MDEMKTRFAQLLPTKIPDAAMCALVKAMLKVKGVGRVAPHPPPRQPCSRR
jgi:hypothetical protein